MCEMLRPAACSLAAAAASAGVLQMPHSGALCRTYFQRCAAHTFKFVLHILLTLCDAAIRSQHIPSNYCAAAHGRLHQNHILCFRCTFLRTLCSAYFCTTIFCVKHTFVLLDFCSTFFRTFDTLLNTRNTSKLSPLCVILSFYAHIL